MTNPLNNMGPNKKFFMFMSGAIGLLGVLIIATVLAGNGLLTKKNGRLSELKLESAVLDRQKEDLVRAQKDVEKYAELERIAKQIVPQDKDQARTVREIIKLGQESNIQIVSVGFQASTLGQAAPKAAAPAEGGGESTPKAPATPPVTQTKPVEGIPNVYQMEISVTSKTDSATFPKLITFLKKLESNRRTAQVGTITITPNATNRNILTFTILLNVYLKP